MTSSQQAVDQERRQTSTLGGESVQKKGGIVFLKIKPGLLFIEQICNGFIKTL